MHIQIGFSRKWPQDELQVDFFKGVVVLRWKQVPFGFILVTDVVQLLVKR